MKKKEKFARDLRVELSEQDARIWHEMKGMAAETGTDRSNWIRCCLRLKDKDPDFDSFVIAAVNGHDYYFGIGSKK